MDSAGGRRCGRGRRRRAHGVVPLSGRRANTLLPGRSGRHLPRPLLFERKAIPHKDAGDGLPECVAELLAEGKVLGWFQGRMELGPRALGGRSILTDPRGRDTRRKVNLKIKCQESFRPFAPSVLWEKASGWFDLDGESPYKLLAAHDRNASGRVRASSDLASSTPRSRPSSTSTAGRAYKPSAKRATL